MKEFVKILRTLTLSTLRNIGSKIDIEKNKNLNSKDERQFLVVEIEKWIISKLKWHETIIVKVSIPLLVGLIVGGVYHQFSKEKINSLNLKLDTTELALDTANAKLSSLLSPIGYKFSTNGFSVDIDPNNITAIDTTFLTSDAFHLFNTLRKTNNLQRSAHILDESIVPNDLKNLLTNKLTSLNILVIDNLELFDINKMSDINKILNIGFDLRGTSNVQASYSIEGVPNKYSYNFALVNDIQKCTGVYKHMNIYSKDEICNKIALVRIPLNSKTQIDYPYNFMVSRFRLKDELQNEFDFIPFRKVKVVQDDYIIKELSNLTYEYTMFVINCKN